jgi:periplasmic protein TonB
MPEWQLLHRVDPEYPSAALAHRIQGTVRFSAIIAKDGHIEALRLISGHPLLVPAARKAAQQWIYRPTLLGDKPVRVITTIDVPFRLDAYGNPAKEPERKSDAAAVL